MNEIALETLRAVGAEDRILALRSRSAGVRARNVQRLDTELEEVVGGSCGGSGNGMSSCARKRKRLHTQEIVRTRSHFENEGVVLLCCVDWTMRAY